MDARYSRQIALPGFGAEGQRRLDQARVLVIGAGGLGSTVIPALAGAGVGTIGVVDDDRVELSNLHRQVMHGVEDIGLAKTESAAAAVAALNPDVTIVPIQSRLTSASAVELFSGYDLVVDGCDNFPTRYLSSDAAVLAGIPLVWGAVSQFGGQAGVSFGTTYRDLFPSPPPPGSVLSCEAGGVLPTVVAVIGSILATEALKLLTGIGEPLIGRVVIYDSLSGRFRELSYQRDPEAEPVTGLIDYEMFCGIPDGPRITPAALAARTDDFLLLDVREPWEAELASIPGSVLMPLGGLDPVGLGATTPVVVYCHHGLRSARACERLAAHGVDAISLAGGIDAWAREIDPAVARY